MSLTYSQYVVALANLAATSPTDPDFVGILPSIIDYAEQRIYRETDLLEARVSDTSQNAVANSRSYTLPTSLGRFVVVDSINVFTPVSSTDTRNLVTPASPDFINMCWPSNTAASATTVPTNYAMLTDQTIIWGPPPGAAFGVEVIGMIRPTPISATNTTTILSLYFPDLFIAASMIFVSGWMRNFGSQADDPKMSASWEAQYNMLKESAMSEEGRKRFAGASWTSKKIEAQAAPQRG